ncbi:M23 family metallopeptidase [Deinococcus yavapaiensis]|uniref:M23 family metallopeptidase n=1 Tax=Deinococcus yavapaiensis TaxID=309889 RepID=UPI001473BA60|nr:M23 family metallopeptidase [Deinococcus yavapaiensis]
MGIIWRIGSSDCRRRWVYVLGAGGWRYYYAHLNDVATTLREGQRVTTSTVLGTVGDSGAAETTPPHLHFAVFERYDANGPYRFPALNPLPWLRDRT